MKKMFLVVIIVFAATLALAGCVMSSTPVPPTEKSVVIASGHADWAPVMYRNDNNTISGIGPNVVRAIFKELGLDVEFPYVGTWDVVQQKAKNGELDVIVALYKTKEREEYLYFSKPYTVDPIVLFLNKNNSFDYNQKEDLINKKGVATTGDSYGQEIDDFIVAKNLDVIRVATPQAAFELLKTGSRDYFIYSAYAGERVIAEENISGIEESKIVSSQLFYIGVSKKSKYANRMGEINATLDKLLAENKLLG